MDKSDRHLARYLHIIRDAPVYPVILDANKTVCSMPPIINSDHTKIKLSIRNVFIDITATDRTKLEIVNQMLVCMFSQYTSEPFTVEPIQIQSPHNNQSRLTPDLTPRKTTASLKYLNGCCGLSLSAPEVCKLLTRMAYTASPSSDPDILTVLVPPTRADVLHQADIMEDLAIAYGFNKLPRKFPSTSATIAKPLPINKLGDIFRLETAMQQWVEVMPLILCSHNENFAYLNREDDGTKAVKLANPKTVEYQVVRTSLVPGLLKTLVSNKHHSLPMRIFEVSDVVLKAPELERKARNERHVAAAYCGKTSGFEIVHGLLDRLMLMFRSAFLPVEEEKLAKREREREAEEKGEGGAGKGGGKGNGKPGGGKGGQQKSSGAKEKPLSERTVYWLTQHNHPTYFAGHAADIHLRIRGVERVIGQFGILHPTVLENYDLKFPVSVLEMNIEPFL